MCQRPRCGCVLLRNLTISCALGAMTMVVALVTAFLAVFLPWPDAVTVATVAVTVVVACGCGLVFRRRQNVALRRLRQSAPSVPVVIAGRRGARLAAQITATQPAVLSIPLAGEATRPRPIVAVATREPRS